MANVVKKITHVIDAQARLPGHLSTATNLHKLVELMANRAQILEDELDLLLNNVTDIATVVGVQLDTIGEILNLERKVGEADSEYRIRLQGEAAQLAKSGEPETVIETYKFITVANSILLVELAPATVELTAFVDNDNFTEAQDAEVVATMQAITAGGIGTILQIVEGVNIFLWGADADANGNGDIIPSITRGLGDLSDVEFFILDDNIFGLLDQSNNSLTETDTIGFGGTELTTGGNFTRTLA